MKIQLSAWVEDWIFDLIIFCSELVSGLIEVAKKDLCRKTTFHRLNVVKTGLASIGQLYPVGTIY
jgi:hypothetical protein